MIEMADGRTDIVRLPTLDWTQDQVGGGAFYLLPRVSKSSFKRYNIGVVFNF